MSIILCFTVFIFFFSAGVKADFVMTNELELINNSVSGPGSNNSILSEGFSFKGDFNFTKRQELNNYDFLLNMGLNTRGDVQSNQQEFNLSRFKARFKNQENDSIFNVGDTFEFFDQYVLNSSLKGISYKQNITTRDSFTFVYGYDYPGWDDIFSDECQAITRRSLGINYKNNRGNKINWGISLLNTDDIEAVDADDILYNNNIYGLSWEYLPIAGLTVRGSSAYGSTEESDGNNYSGTAHKVKIFSSAKEGRASIDYERVEPEFKTLLGSATNDVEKYRFSLLYRYSRKINYNFDYTYYHDNINKQKEDTTYYCKPSAGVSIKHLFDRRYASTSLKYNYNKKETTTKKIEDNIFSINYRDRFKLLDVNMNVNYAQEEEKVDSDINKENEITYNLSLSTRKRMEKYILRPVLRFGYFKNDDEEEDNSNSNFEKSLELGFDIPAKKISSSLKLGEREALSDSSEDNSKLFANLSIYYRPQFLDKYNRGRVYLKLKYNDVNYSENVDENFSENTVTTGINFGF